MSIVIIDYGMGNLASVYNALKFLGESPKIGESPSQIEKADKLVLPGVGAFRDSMLGLEKRGLIGPIKKSLSSGKAYLGICLGLQLLFEGSEEANAEGLGVFKGFVRRFWEKDGVKVPHIGWNNIKIKNQKLKIKITEDIKDGSYFYFDHSYYADPRDKSLVMATTDYGVNFASIVRKDNIYAVQFHPERSQGIGLKFLENFIKV